MRIRWLLMLVFFFGIFSAVSFAQSCRDAKLSGLGTAKLETDKASEVSVKTRISWNPRRGCPLVIQAYQGGELIGQEGKENGKDVGVPSDSKSIGDLTHGKTGKTEIKIWVPNVGRFDSVWVNVKN